MTKPWLINVTRGYDLNSEPQTLEALQNAFILIYRCDIYPYIMYIFYLLEKANVLKAAAFM